MKSIEKLLSITREQLEEVEKVYFDSLEENIFFKADEYSEHVAKSFSTEIDSIRNIMWDSDTFKNSVYKETPEVINSLIKRGYQLGVYSKGQYEFQYMKYKAIDEVGEFDKDLLYIADQKTEPVYISKLPEGAIIVDDKMSIVDALVKSEKNITPIWINRKGNQVHSKVKTIFCLQELLQLV